MAALSGKSKDPKSDSVNRVLDKKHISCDKQYELKTETNNQGCHNHKREISVQNPN